MLGRSKGTPEARALAEEQAYLYMQLKEAEARIAASPDGKLFLEYLQTLTAGDFLEYGYAKTMEEKRRIDGRVERCHQIQEALVRASEVLANLRLKEKKRGS